MNKEQIAILTTLFVLTFLGYRFLKKRFSNVSEWIKLNLLFLLVGTIGAASLTPFIYPFAFSRNLVVLIVIPFCTYNIYYLINELAVSFGIGKIAREIISFFSILIGIIIGAQLINLLGFSVFQNSDIQETFLIAFLFNTARMLLSYSVLVKEVLKKQSELKLVKIKQTSTETQLDILHSKINPHFLYNSLNSIAGLAMVDGKKTKEMTIALSKLLRYSLNYSQSNFATLEEEAEIIQTYLDVEKIRFGENLDYEIYLSDEAKKYFIPRFLLQPIVENGIKHAFTESEGGNFIKVNMDIAENEIVIIIQDNGKPFPDTLTPGYGLKSVNDKLQLLLPDKHEFQITNTPQKQVKIVIKELKKKDEYLS